MICIAPKVRGYRGAGGVRLRLSKQMSLKMAFKSENSASRSNVRRQRVPCVRRRDRECSSSDLSTCSPNGQQRSVRRPQRPSRHSWSD